MIEWNEYAMLGAGSKFHHSGDSDSGFGKPTLPKQENLRSFLRKEGWKGAERKEDLDIVQ